MSIVGEISFFWIDRGIRMSSLFVVIQLVYSWDFNLNYFDIIVFVLEIQEIKKG